METVKKMENKAADHENKMAGFRAEIMAFKFDEERANIEGNPTTAHFLNMEMDSAELNEEDLQFWEKINEGTITRDDITKHRELITDFKTGNLKAGIPGSRYTFFLFATNKASKIVSGRELEEMQREKP